MSQGFDVPADSLAFERRPLSQKFLSQVVPGVAAVCVMALACAAALHLGAGGAQRGAKLDSWRPRSRPIPAETSANPYGVLVDPGFRHRYPAGLAGPKSLATGPSRSGPARSSSRVAATAPRRPKMFLRRDRSVSKPAAPLPPPRPSEFGALASLPAPVRAFRAAADQRGRRRARPRTTAHSSKSCSACPPAGARPWPMRSRKAPFLRRRARRKAPRPADPRRRHRPLGAIRPLYRRLRHLGAYGLSAQWRAAGGPFGPGRGAGQLAARERAHARTRRRPISMNFRRANRFSTACRPCA